MTATGTEEWYVYDPRGERIGTFTVTTSGTYPYLTPYLVLAQSNVWFAGKLVNRYNAATYTQSAVYRDRLGSEHGLSQRYYPYGEEITSTANDTEKYATYFRDSFTTLDYADQRYYASTYGRFNTVDPMGVGASPGSFNGYAYAQSDPINGRDPRGLFVEGSGDGCDYGLDDGDGTDDGGGECSDVPPYNILAVCATNPSWAIENPEDCGNPVSVPFTQGNGANSFIKIANLSTTSVQAITVQNDLRWLQQAISQDPSCDSWLQGSYAAISYMLDAPGSGATMMAVGVGNFPAGTNAVAGTGGTNLPAGMLVTVALNGAFFQKGVSPGFGLPAWVAAGSDAVQAEILLHELAHDPGAAGMQSDGPLPNGQPNVQAQTINNQAVMTNCGGVVALAAGRN